MSTTSDQTALDGYIAARTKILNSQSYTDGTHSLQRAMLSEVEKGVDKYEKRLDSASRGGIRVRGAKIV